MTEYLRAYAYRFSDWGIADNGRIEYPECAHVTRHPQFERCEASERQATFFYRAAEVERFGDAERIKPHVAINGFGFLYGEPVLHRRAVDGLAVPRA